MANMINPFTRAFGREPNSLIERQKQVEQIKETFLSPNPITYAYLITGVRGSGKTVLLSTICEDFKKKDDWIVVELNPDRNMLESFGAKLYEKSHLKYKFLQKEISFSFQGLTLSLSGKNPVYDVESLLEKMLSILDKHGKKVLVAIDEVSNNKEVRTFVQSFQILNRQKLPVYLLMTGLYKNIKKLEDYKTTTFLYRAPKIDLDPLDLLKIKNVYRDILNVDNDIATKLARLTKGYAFGYQTLGYLVFENNNKLDNKVIEKYDEYLKEYVYDKIWSELANVDRQILTLLAESDDGDVETIYKKMNMKKTTFASYRDKLIKNGVIHSIGWGFIEFSLPRFSEYIKTINELF